MSANSSSSTTKCQWENVFVITGVRYPFNFRYIGVWLIIIQTAKQSVFWRKSTRVGLNVARKGSGTSVKITRLARGLWALSRVAHNISRKRETVLQSNNYYALQHSVAQMSLLTALWQHDYNDLLTGIPSLLICFAFNFRHVMTFTRYYIGEGSLGFWIVFVITGISLYWGSLYRGSVPYILL